MVFSLMFMNHGHLFIVFLDFIICITCNVDLKKKGALSVGVPGEATMEAISVSRRETLISRI